MKQTAVQLLKAISIIFIIPIYGNILALCGLINICSDLFDEVVEDFKNK